MAKQNKAERIFYLLSHWSDDDIVVFLKNWKEQDFLELQYLFLEFTVEKHEQEKRKKKPESVDFSPKSPYNRNITTEDKDMEENLKPKTKEQVRAEIRARNENAKPPALDEFYYRVEVPVYKISFMDGTYIYVSEKVGEEVQDKLVSDNPAKVIKLSSGLWQIHQITNIVAATQIFNHLSDWTKHKVLEEHPNLFDNHHYDRYSDMLKNKISDWKEGKNLSKDLKVEKRSAETN